MSVTDHLQWFLVATESGNCNGGYSHHARIPISQAQYENREQRPEYPRTCETCGTPFKAAQLFVSEIRIRTA